MPRKPREIVPHFAYHVTQRGNRRAAIFQETGDYERFRSLLGRYARRDGVDVMAYCLMPNHVHLVVVPTAIGLSNALRDVFGRYALEFNRRRRLDGHLWQGRYHSVALSEVHMYAAMRYVERNPVAARLSARAEDWHRSSAPHHCGIAPDFLVAAGRSHAPVTGGQWSAWLANDGPSSDISMHLPAFETR